MVNKINEDVALKPIDIAKKEIGQKEIKGKIHNPKIIEYHSSVSLHATEDEVPWCSSFVNWCLKQCGIKGTNSAAARSFLKWGKIVNEPDAGDIIILKRGSSQIYGHVGFVYEKPNMLNPYVKVLGGNQDNQVCVKSFLRVNVLGYRRQIENTK